MCRLSKDEIPQTHANSTADEATASRHHITGLEKHHEPGIAVSRNGTGPVGAARGTLGRGYEGDGRLSEGTRIPRSRPARR